jgi:hypothetical protein
VLLQLLHATVQRCERQFSVAKDSSALRKNHPPPDVLDELLNLATSAMYEARRAGGNQYRLLLAPPLTVLDDPHEDNWVATDESA